MNWKSTIPNLNCPHHETGALHSKVHGCKQHYSLWDDTTFSWNQASMPMCHVCGLSAQTFGSSKNLALASKSWAAWNWLQHRTNAFVWLLVLIDGVAALGDIPWDSSHPYHSQSIRRRHTWCPILLPHPNSNPQSSTPPHHKTPHTLLTSSSKKQPSNSPTGPGGLLRKPSCARSGTHFAQCWQGAHSHSGGGTLEQQQVWGPRTAAYTSPGHPGLGGAHIPQQSPRFADCKYICRICPNGIWWKLPPITDWPGMPRKRSSVNQADQAEKAENVFWKRLVMFVPSLYSSLNSRGSHVGKQLQREVCIRARPPIKCLSNWLHTSRPLYAIECLRWGGAFWAHLDWTHIGARPLLEHFEFNCWTKIM